MTDEGPLLLRRVCRVLEFHQAELRRGDLPRSEAEAAREVKSTEVDFEETEARPSEWQLPPGAIDSWHRVGRRHRRLKPSALICTL